MFFRKLLTICILLLSSTILEAQWITPTKDICIKHGGKISIDNLCIASWQKSKLICKAEDARLASFEELEKVMLDCNGKLNDYKNNRANSSYQKCYKSKGFSKLEYYWSATPIGNRSRDAWFIDFSNGGKNYLSKDNEYSVQCIRKKQKAN